MSRYIPALLLTASTAALVAGSTSGASAAMTMSLGDPSHAAKVLVTVPVTVACTPFDPSLTHFSSSATVSIEQAAGKSIAHGSGFAFTPAASSLLFPCDGADHTVDVGVTADPASPPFKRGAAAATASAFAFAGLPCGPGCFFNLTPQSAGVGPTEVKIH
jgi:hypothetical protein